ncbi:threonine--tRNA ligase [Paraliomyxa miuraensis]|uniref:threonine--tRNA ligase n=1 Tax=Paraliomyxa miuraensis TaxID=376150 RepID=UPI00225AF38C|nr:threonine--tRNA ligase [Paraliomyxa miuraensis]MCX4242417.1 threonine--tRNA ligase [Paraliomyxa miuraensis]
MSISVSLPDGSAKELPLGSTVRDLAKAISPRLAKAAVLGVVDDRPVDLGHALTDGSRVRIVTSEDPLGLDTLRHSAAHLMAAAILEEVPGAQLTIGPTTDDGFYYDIHLPEGSSLSESDFPRIEARMKVLADADAPFVRCEASSKDSEVYREYVAIDGGNNPFKQEIIEGLQAQGAFSGAADAPTVSFYRTGSFIDLCRGPHVPSSKWLRHTKLMKIAGAYWRADASREQLVRVYGTAFFTKEDLDGYLHMLEEARKRDHRVLGEKLDLFHFEDEAPGFPFLHPRGALVYNTLIEFMRSRLRHHGYQEVRTPLILPETTWHTSGHYDHYMENMFFTRRKLRDKDDPEKILSDVEEDRAMAVKPMNCPGHLIIYRHRMHSHHELPLRIAEMGQVHRREPSGVRHGMFRVQSFVQDDGHHFCTPQQLESEITMLIAFYFEVYGVFGLDDVRLELSTRPEKSIGSDEMWEKAEGALRGALEAVGRPYQVNEGDGAFYGPKIDFHIRDSIGRTWQCGTIQVDFSMPERFGLEYVGADGGRHTPVMVHKACYGSLERFFGIITEHFAGAYPLWLAPEQVRVLPVSEKVLDYAKDVVAQLREAGLRAELDASDERLGYKIRTATMMKVPYLVVVGAKEVEAGTINVRCRDAEDLGESSVSAFVQGLPPFDVPALVTSLRKRAAAARAAE